ncbi:hypothetical protein EME01_58990 [Sinorhizobium meliloti]|nr:hypothetical protein EME01_58990 [Sinorhizobium meliloti]
MLDLGVTQAALSAQTCKGPRWDDGSRNDRRGRPGCKGSASLTVTTLSLRLALNWNVGDQLLGALAEFIDNGLPNL